MMIHVPKTTRYIICAAVVIAIPIVFFRIHTAAPGEYHDDAVTTYHRTRVQDAMRSALGPLRNDLTALGFTNLDTPETDCSFKTVRKDPHDQGFYVRDDGIYFDCSSGIDRAARIPTDTAGRNVFLQNAKNLDTAVRANGWSRGINLPWFEKVSQRGNFIANDQPTGKMIDQYSCDINFFTAYSDPDPPAISVRIFCGIHYKL